MSKSCRILIRPALMKRLRKELLAGSYSNKAPKLFLLCVYPRYTFCLNSSTAVYALGMDMRERARLNPFILSILAVVGLQAVQSVESDYLSAYRVLLLNTL
jgi:hypothetical protein